MDDRELAKRLDSIENKIDDLLEALTEENEEEIEEDDTIQTREKKKDYT